MVCIIKSFADFTPSVWPTLTCGTNRPLNRTTSLQSGTTAMSTDCSRAMSPVPEKTEFPEFKKKWLDTLQFFKKPRSHRIEFFSRAEWIEKCDVRHPESDLLIVLLPDVLYGWPDFIRRDDDGGCLMGLITQYFPEQGFHARKPEWKISRHPGLTDSPL